MFCARDGNLEKREYNEEEGLRCKKPCTWPCLTFNVKLLLSRSGMVKCRRLIAARPSSPLREWPPFRTLPRPGARAFGPEHIRPWPTSVLTFCGVKSLSFAAWRPAKRYSIDRETLNGLTKHCLLPTIRPMKVRQVTRLFMTLDIPQNFLLL